MSSVAWLRPPEVDPAARVRLFLFHYAGGGIGMYSRWPALLPADIACQRVHLPGRHERHAEPPFTALDPLLDRLITVLAAELDHRPYVLFGHSMGALLAYRLAVALPRLGNATPALLAVAGFAPAFPAPPSLESLDLDAHADLPIAALEADVQVVASYRDDGAKVECPIVAYAGGDDPLLSPADMGAWTERTATYLGCREFAGGHFFIHDHAEAITADLAQVIGQRVA